MADNQAFFSVSPKLDCPHIVEHIKITTAQVKEGFTTNKCHDCTSNKENWMCGTCGVVACSRYVASHMSAHNNITNHPITVSFSDLSVWCYLCDSYISSPQLLAMLGVLHQAKFGHQMPGESYFICDSCSKRIKNNVRWRCTVCEDFDLCTECKNNGKFDPPHTAEHTLTSNLDHEKPPTF